MKPYQPLDVPAWIRCFESMITLHVLGAGGATPTPTHGPAAYWVDLDGCGVLMDPGPGALVRLVRQPGAPDDVDEIDTVLISHLHLDHTADLAPLLFAQHLALATRSGELLLAGPVGLSSYLMRLQDLYGDWLEPCHRSLEVVEMAPGERIELAQGARVEALPASHPVDRFGSQGGGWLLTDAQGHRLAYTGDTGPRQDLGGAATGCDCLLTECSAPDDLVVETHLSPASVVEMVRNIRPAQVVLTHMYPAVIDQEPHLAIESATGVPCHAARDGDRYTIPRTTENPT